MATVNADTISHILAPTYNFLHALGGVSGVASFITTDEWLQ